jgi:type II secretion system protein H
MSRKAFTFIELLIVLILMGILAAVAAPKFVASMSRCRVEAAAKRVVADLRYARQWARTNSTSVEVKFKPDEDQYELKDVPDINRPSDEETEVELDKLPYPAQIIETTGFDNNDKFNFDMYGRPDSPGTVTVASGGYQATVTVGESGQITISGVSGP